MISIGATKCITCSDDNDLFTVKVPACTIQDINDVEDCDACVVSD